MRTVSYPFKRNSQRKAHGCGAGKKIHQRERQQEDLHYRHLQQAEMLKVNASHYL